MSSSIPDHLRATLRLAIPVSIGQLGHILLGVTDSLMVGTLGAVPLAGASLGHGVFVLLLVFAAGMASAITPLTAIADGEGKPDDARNIVRQGLLQNVLTATLILAAAWGLAELLPLLGQPPEVVAQAAPYLRVMGLSFIPMLVFMSVRNFIEGLSYTKPAMVIILLANLVNVAGNWVFIHGHFGMPALGLTGAGISSVLVEIFAAIALLLYVSRARAFARYRPLFHRGALDLPLQRRLFRLGLPSGTQWLSESGSFTFCAVMMGWLGTTALAAHQIALNLAAVSYMAILGLSNASMIRVGNALGRRDATDLKRAGFSALGMALTVMALAATTFVLLRWYFPTLFVSDPAVIELAASLLVIAALFQLSDGTQAVGLGILRGMTDVTVPMIVAIVAYWLIGVPASYVFAFVLGWGPEGVWLGFVVGLTVAGLSFIFRFRMQYRRLRALWKTEQGSQALADPAV